LSQCYYYVQVSHTAWLRTALQPVKWPKHVCVRACVKYETVQGGEEIVLGLI